MQLKVHCIDIERCKQCRQPAFLVMSEDQIDTLVVEGKFGGQLVVSDRKPITPLRDGLEVYSFENNTPRASMEYVAGNRQRICHGDLRRIDISTGTLSEVRRNGRIILDVGGRELVVCTSDNYSETESGNRW